MKMFLVLWMLHALTGMTRAIDMPDGMENAVLDEKLHFDVNADGEITEENIEMNYEENYVRVTTPAHGLFQNMVLIHDYNEDVTLFKLDGKCHAVNEYADIPEKMSDWLNLRFDIRDGALQGGGKESYRAHYFKAMPSSEHGTMLPQVMQDECEDIDTMMYEKTVEGVEAYSDVHEGHHEMGIVYLPSLRAAQAASGREKRGWFLPRRNPCMGCFQCFIIDN